jgi:ATP-dependent Lon protease
MIVVKTRHANVRPDCEHCSKNAALRNRVKKSIEKTQQEEAFKELLKLMGANGGKAPYGEVKNIVKAYNANGFKAKTRQNLYYCLSQLKFSTTSSKDNTNSQLVGTIVTGNNTE